MIQEVQFIEKLTCKSKSMEDVFEKRWIYIMKITFFTVCDNVNMFLSNNKLVFGRWLLC